MDLRRIIQVMKYGWKHAGVISSETNKPRIWLFYDILLSYRKFHLWSNQYLKEHFYSLNREERERIGNEYKVKNDIYEEIKRDKIENRVFLNKWKSYYWELGYQKRREKRRIAYAKRYNMGENCDISFNVHIERNHNLPGTIRVGNNVLIAKNVYIDYSGELIIHDNVAIANGVIIETHTHSLEKIRHLPIPSRLEIGESVKLLSRSYIADTCHSIGRYARIGAGSYVRSNVPPYAIVMGNPAKIIGFLYSPEEMVEFEETRYDETNRTPVEQYKKDYQKFFLSRRAEIKAFIRK